MFINPSPSPTQTHRITQASNTEHRGKIVKVVDIWANLGFVTINESLQFQEVLKQHANTPQVTSLPPPPPQANPAQPYTAQTAFPTNLKRPASPPPAPSAAAMYGAGDAHKTVSPVVKRARVSTDGGAGGHLPPARWVQGRIKSPTYPISSFVVM